MKALGTVETVCVQMCWVDFPQRHLGGTTLLWMPPEAVKLVKFEILLSPYGQRRRWGVDAVYPLEPLPDGLSIRSKTILRNLIAEELARILEDPVATWSHDKIDTKPMAVA